MGNQKYDRTNTRTISIKLNRRTDADILDKIEAVGQYAGYIKSLIREDISKTEHKTEDKPD